jgi:hypothetical protein
MFKFYKDMEKGKNENLRNQGKPTKPKKKTRGKF